MYMVLTHLIFNFSAPRLILFSQIRISPDQGKKCGALQILNAISPKVSF